MTLATKPLDDVGPDNLQALVGAGVAEGRTVEFKQSVGSADRDKREFLTRSSARPAYASAGAGARVWIGVEVSTPAPAKITGRSATLSGLLPPAEQ
jgi:hypothetical protein